MIRVVLAEDNYLVREGVLRLLEAEDDLDVVAVCEDLPSLEQAISEQSPDVVLTDIRMPPDNSDEGIQVAGSVVDPKVVEALVGARSTKSSPLDELTPRERETLEQMAQGKTNAAIAASFVITERSVETAVHAIFQKLGLTWQEDINRRVKAVLLYLAEG